MSENNENVVQQNLQKPRKRLNVNNKKIFYYSLMAFPLLQFCVFYIGVNFQSILLAFQEYSDYKFDFAKGNIFVNFKQIIDNCVDTNTIPLAIRNSLILWFFNALCGTVLAVLFSYYIFKRKKTGRFYRFVLFLPSILPGVLLTIVFELFTQSIFPAVFGWQKVLDSTNPTVVLTTVIAYTVFLGFGTQVLLYSNAMEQISPSVLEAAQLDGAKPMVELWYIVLPEIMGTVSTFMIASIAGAFTNQANLYNFYGADAMDFSETNTLGYYMFTLVQDSDGVNYGKQQYGYASALGLCCTAIAIPPMLLFRKFSKRFEE